MSLLSLHNQRCILKKKTTTKPKTHNKDTTELPFFGKTLNLVSGFRDCPSI